MDDEETISSPRNMASLPTHIQPKASSTSTTKASSKRSIRVALLGNSILYYNDTPRLLVNLLKRRGYTRVTQDSCLRGGSTLVSLARNGNGMSSKFHTPAALRSDGTYDIGSPTVQSLLAKDWDFVIVNDHTQAPARDGSRAASKEALQSTYLPQWVNSDGSRPTVIFLMTAAYRSPVSGSDDLGTVEEFTALLQEGYKEYQAVTPGSKIAPVGLAYQYLHQHHPDVWDTLYATDDLHPSPHGTLLQTYVLFATMTNSCPPMKYLSSWWNVARYMQPPEEDPSLPLPTAEEAAFLRTIACQVCGV